MKIRLSLSSQTLELQDNCIRMRNADVMGLFEQVPVGTPVTFTE